jgi:hypothetical protein
MEEEWISLLNAFVFFQNDFYTEMLIALSWWLQQTKQMQKDVLHIGIHMISKFAFCNRAHFIHLKCLNYCLFKSCFPLSKSKLKSTWETLKKIVTQFWVFTVTNTYNLLQNYRHYFQSEIIFPFSSACSICHDFHLFLIHICLLIQICFLLQTAAVSMILWNWIMLS